MSGREQTVVLVATSIELALTATAAVDLWRRPQAGIRGPKALWAVCLVIQPFGPIAYLTVGARRGSVAEVGKLAG
jgi:hypothetical protein